MEKKKVAKRNTLMNSYLHIWKVGKTHKKLLPLQSPNKTVCKKKSKVFLWGGGVIEH